MIIYKIMKTENNELIINNFLKYLANDCFVDIFYTFVSVII